MAKQSSMFRPKWWRGNAPAHDPAGFFLNLRTGVYYDRLGTWWGRPVYRQRIGEMWREAASMGGYDLM